MPNYATVGLKHLGNGAEFLRAVSPEAVVTIGGERWEIGGLQGQPDRGYLEPAWLARMTASTNAFRYAGYRLSQPEARYPWKPRYGAAPVPWPPKGVQLDCGLPAAPLFRTLQFLSRSGYLAAL